MATLTGTAGADQITGTGADDRILGLEGDDTLSGGGGTDTLLGGDGDDLIFASAFGGVIDGAAGNDTLDLSAAGVPTRVDLNLAIPQQPWGSGASLTVIGVENLIGAAAAANTLIGDAQGNHLTGGAAADTLVGGAGDDRLEGGGGFDTAVFGANAATFAISARGGRWAVADATSGLALGLDTVTGVEAFQFADRFVDLGLRDGAVDAAARNILRDAGAWSVLVGNGLEPAAQAMAEIAQAAGATSSVAILAYQFFTGKVPSAAGMDFLVAPSGPNPNNINAAYYQSFGLENRYINFAVNLGKVGEGRAAFEAAYGAQDLFAATRDAYATIFGEAPPDSKLHAILDPVTVLNGVAYTRAEYFAYYGGDGLGGIGTKAAMVGWLLAEAVKADVGMYALSNDAFLRDLADGAAFAVDLVGLYGRPEFVFHPE